MTEAGRQFRRVNGHLHLKTLRTALERHVGTNDVGPTDYDHTVSAA